MDIEKLSRWHWAVIGLLVGLLLGWGAKSLDDAGGLGDAGSLGVGDFERELTASNRRHPILRNIVVHQSQGDWAVTLQRLEMDPREKYPHNPRHFRYVDKRLDARTPYVPVDTAQTVDVRIDPSAQRMEASSGRGYWTLAINGRKVVDWPAQLKLEGWKTSSGHWSDPGAGATAQVALRWASYQLTVVLDPSQSSAAAPGRLRITFNGRELPAAWTSTPGGPACRTTLPAELFTPAEYQVLSFADGGPPLKIRQIRLLDANYTVLNYLAAIKRNNPQVVYRTAWWEKPTVLYTLYATGGVVVIGGIWPVVLRLLLGAGFGRHAPAEEPYDLSRFGGRPESKIAAPARPGEPLDTEALDALEQELRRSLSQHAMASDKPPCETRPVSPLNAIASDVAAAAPSDEHKEYQGEYYPVVRKSADPEP